MNMWPAAVNLNVTSTDQLDDHSFKEFMMDFLPPVQSRSNYGDLGKGL